MVKNRPASVGDIREMGSIPGSRRSPGEGHGNPLQYFHLEKPMDRGAWQDTVHRVAKSQAWLKWLGTHPLHLCSSYSIRALERNCQCWEYKNFKEDVQIHKVERDSAWQEFGGVVTATEFLTGRLFWGGMHHFPSCSGGRNGPTVYHVA